jgi:hypothetical protein
MCKIIHKTTKKALAIRQELSRNQAKNNLVKVWHKHYWFCFPVNTLLKTTSRSTGAACVPQVTN